MKGYMILLGLVLLLLTIHAATAALNISEVGIMGSCGKNCVYNDDNVFLYANYTNRTTSNELGNNSQWALYVNDVPVASGTVTQTLALDFENRFFSMSGHNASTTISSMSITGGAFGNSLYITDNGSKGYLNYNDSNSHYNLSQGTIMFSMKSVDNTTNELYGDFIVGGLRINTSTAFDFKWEDDAVRIGTLSDTQGWRNVASRNITHFDQGDWHNIAFTWQYNVSKDIWGKWCVYIDGFLDNCDWYEYNESGVYFDNDSTLSLFSFWNPSPGQYDNFAMYKKAWTEEAISEYHNRNMTLYQGYEHINNSLFTTGDTLIVSYKYCDEWGTCSDWTNGSSVVVSQRQANITVNYNTITGKVNISIGGNLIEKYIRALFDNQSVRNALSGIDHDSCAVWTNTEYDENNNILGTDTYPLKKDGYYNWTDFDKMINTSLTYCDSLLVKLACTPGNLTEKISSEVCLDSVSPDNPESWANYTYMIINHTCSLFGNTTCEAIYWQQFNEPHESNWTVNNTVSLMYLNATIKMKSYNSNLKVGAGSFGMLKLESLYNQTIFFLDYIKLHDSECQNGCLDFFTVNHYMDYALVWNGNWSDTQRPLKEDGIDKVWYDSFKRNPDLYKNITSTVYSHYGNIPIWNTEFNLHSTLGLSYVDGDNSSSPRVHLPVQASMFASYINSNIDSNITKHFVYVTYGSYTERNNYDGWDNAYSMFNIDKNDTGNISYYNVYYTLRDFARYVPPGSTIVSSTSSHDDVEVLAVKQDTNQTLVLINKLSANVSVNVSLSNNLVNRWVNANKTSEFYDSSDDGSFLVALSPYQVLFLSGNQPTASEVGIVTEDGNVYEDSWFLAYNNYSSADINAQNMYEIKLWKNVSGTTTLVYEYNNTHGLTCEFNYGTGAFNQDCDINFSNAGNANYGNYGYRGGAYNFTGIATSYLNLNNPQNLQGINSSNNWTIHTKVMGLCTIGYILFKENSWSLDLSNGGVVRFQRRGGAFEATQSNRLCQNYTWMDILVTNDATGNLMTIYVNGANSTTTQLGVAFNGSNGNLLVGRDSTQTFNGTIDDLWIQYRHIGWEEAAELYRSNVSVHNDMFGFDANAIGLNVGNSVIISSKVRDNTSTWSAEVNSTTTLIENDNVTLHTNFSISLITTIFSVGINEGNYWKNFTYNSSIVEIHNELGLSYVRLPIGNISGSSDNYPYDCETWDFTLLDDMIINVLKNTSYTPILTYWNFPLCIRRNNEKQPANQTAVYDYIHNTTQHIYNNCNNGSWMNCSTSGDRPFSQWYITIINEPNLAPQWGSDANYSMTYNSSLHAIHNVSASFNNIVGFNLFGTKPGASQETYLDSFLSNISELHWLGINLYMSNFETYITNNGYMDNTSFYADNMGWLKNKLSIKFPEAKLMLIEYNSDSNSNERMRNSFNTAWTGSVLNHLIRSSNVSFGLYWQASENSDTFGHGVWSLNNLTRSGTFDVLQLFNVYIPNGSRLVDSNSSNSDFEVLAAKKGQQSNAIVLINKRDATINASVSVGANVKWVDANTSSRSINSTGGVMNWTLQPYEVLFLVNNYSIIPSIALPESGRTYNGVSSIDLSTSYASTNAKSACYYSLDGAANVSYDCSSVLIPVVSHSVHTIVVSVVDVLNGVGQASVSFTTEAAGGGGGGGGGAEPEANETVVEEVTDEFVPNQVVFLDKVKAKVGELVESFKQSEAYKKYDLLSDAKKAAVILTSGLIMWWLLKKVTR